MPSLQNKALLVRLEADLAQNNVRRNILSFRVNVQSLSNNVAEQSVILQPGQVWTFPVVLNNSITIARALYAANALPITVNAQNAGFYAFTLNSLWVHTDNLVSLTFTNPDPTNAAQLYVSQA